MTRLVSKNLPAKLAYMLHNSEFRCKCSRENCVYTMVSSDLLVAWERLRRTLKKTIHINSGFRCQGHNKDVGGLDNSRHTMGLALDLVPSQGLNFETLVKEAKEVFDYVQVYEEKGFIHCHMNPKEYHWGNH